MPQICRAKLATFLFCAGQRAAQASAAHTFPALTHPLFQTQGQDFKDFKATQGKVQLN